jgi:hypothetical protein
VRVLCSGKTLAFQANDRGSIPLTRFIFDPSATQIVC